ncbi:MAG: PEP-CTERM sorting domain-containing protein [Phycisphaerales bacterium]
MMFTRLPVTIAVIALSTLASASAWAAPYLTMTDNNAAVNIDPDSSAGISAWTVDGVDHLNYQWLWYRVGTGPELAFDSANFSSVSVTQPLSNMVLATYTDSVNQFTINVQWLLVGGLPGSGLSDLQTIVTINNINANTEAAPIDFAVFQYSDFDLNNTPGNDTIEITGPTNYNTARQYDGSTQIHETVVSLTPDIYIADLIDSSNDLLPLLNDGSMTNFTSNIPGPVGPGDASWLFGWTAPLAPGETLPFSKDQSIVPEPATLALFASGLALIASRKRTHA